MKPLQYNVLLLSQSQEKGICKVTLFFRMFLKAFSFTKQCSLPSFASLPASGAQAFRSLGSGMTKRMGFHKNDLNSAKSTVYGRMVPKEWDLILYQLYSTVFRRKTTPLMLEWDPRGGGIRYLYLLLTPRYKAIWD